MQKDFKDCTSLSVTLYRKVPFYETECFFFKHKWRFVKTYVYNSANLEEIEVSHNAPRKTLNEGKQEREREMLQVFVSNKYI